jgi:hypothetical protein
VIRHYFASALTRFRKSPFTTAANILTLALGLACFVAAYGIATYWRSGDSHHPDADRLVYIEHILSGEPFGDHGITNLIRAASLREEVSELEAVARINGNAANSSGRTPYSAGDSSAHLQSKAGRRRRCVRRTISC